MIKWTKHDQPLQNVSGSVLVFNDTLKFLHVRHSDSGAYKCTARNSAGTSSAEASLNVLVGSFSFFILSGSMPKLYIKLGL